MRVTLIVQEHDAAGSRRLACSESSARKVIRIEQSHHVAALVLWLMLLAGGAMLAACNPSSSDAKASVAPSAAAVSTNIPSAVPLPSPTHLPRQHEGDHIAGLADPIYAAHVVDSYPNHAQVLAASPARVVINFDVKLTSESTVTVEKDGKLVENGAPQFDDRRISMTSTLPPQQGDGLYVVKYRGCLSNGSCSDGEFGFKVDSSIAQSFVDLTGRSAVTIRIKDVMYNPAQLVLRRGTQVTWVNDDPFEHFVNSDPHPSHNAFPNLNSLDIQPSTTFEFTFDQPGEYAFHCSAHVPERMFGRIIVLDADATAQPTTIAQDGATAAPTERTAEPTAQLTPVPPPSTPVPTSAPTETPTPIPTPGKQKAPEGELPPQVFAAHFVSSNPEHADLLPAPPEKVKINFNFTLARISSINITKDGQKLTLGDPELSDNRLAMEVSLPENLGEGVYVVAYKACWPDRSCHDGQFAFKVQTAP